MRMKVVILCGGMGIRFKGFIDDIPKPLIKIGDTPVLLHVMDHFAGYGHTDFILCLGYRKEDFIKYFLGSEVIESKEVKDAEGSVTISFVRNNRTWKVNLLDTGESTNTGGRVKQALQYVSEANCCVTYADAISNLRLDNLYDFHKLHGKAATVTVTKVKYQYGVVKFNEEKRATAFEEKPFLDTWINMGFFVFDTNYLKQVVSPSDTLEIETIGKLIEKQNLYCFEFTGFWRSMDTYKEYIELNEMYGHGDALWQRN